MSILVNLHQILWRLLPIYPIGFYCFVFFSPCNMKCNINMAWLFTHLIFLMGEIKVDQNSNVNFSPCLQSCHRKKIAEMLPLLRENAAAETLKQ